MDNLTKIEQQKLTKIREELYSILVDEDFKLKGETVCTIIEQNMEDTETKVQEIYKNKKSKMIGWLSGYAIGEAMKCFTNPQDATWENVNFVFIHNIATVLAEFFVSNALYYKKLEYYSNYHAETRKQIAKKKKQNKKELCENKQKVV